MAAAHAETVDPVVRTSSMIKTLSGGSAIDIIASVTLSILSFVARLVCDFVFFTVATDLLKGQVKVLGDDLTQLVALIVFPFTQSQGVKEEYLETFPPVSYPADHPLPPSHHI